VRRTDDNRVVSSSPEEYAADPESIRPEASGLPSANGSPPSEMDPVGRSPSNPSLSANLRDASSPDRPDPPGPPDPPGRTHPDDPDNPDNPDNHPSFPATRTTAVACALTASPAADEPRPAPAAVQLPLRSAAGRWVIAAAIGGSAMALLDSTVANIALPTIGRELHTGTAGLQWVVNGYTLSLASLILFAGSLGDRFGQRLIFTTGVIWFGAASLLCGLAPDIGLLITFRILQGVGGALLTPGALALIQTTFRPADRARAVGLWSGASGVSGAIGPVVGGLLIQHAGWRWVFLINPPLALVVAGIALTRIPAAGAGPGGRRIDFSGTAFGVLALGALAFGLTRAGETGLGNTSVISALALALMAGYIFGLSQRRGRNPMVPRGLFANRDFTAANLVTFLCYGSIGTIAFFLVLDLQEAGGFSPTEAGLALLPLTLVMLLLASRIGQATGRFGARPLLTAGSAVAAGGAALLAERGVHSGYWTGVLPATAVFAVGFACVAVPVTVAVLASTSQANAGIASGVNNSVARAASLIAIAALPPLVGLKVGSSVGPDVLHAAYRSAMWVVAALLGTAAVMSWFLISPAAARAPEPEPEPEQVPQPVSEPE
jgi:EmrB/QacA subfamily drug resistance transporter